MNEEEKEEKPFLESKRQTEEPLTTKERYSIWMRLKGHDLLLYCVIFSMLMCAFDFFYNDKSLLKEFLELFKTLIFTLCGYLFGKHNKDI